ncbi:alpha/beta-hydrolase [Rhizodiscina lignyota]|uniref:Alpha/beta-hydrolase n=1 Tax=Rhizodiscina lignyota TaxID=1504668 RepID=A0A9P4MEA1_9PEZI|nr:alpha/beta-hydrolase [Rhizodiscina lignyota]
MTTLFKGQQLPPIPLPSGLTERQVEVELAGMSYHVIEAGGTPARDRPLVLLCHGYPELAYSWRKIMPTLASAGYYCVAMDQRGYGRTIGWDTSSYYQVNMSQFTMTTLVRDTAALVNCLGYKKVHCIIGHDFGAVTAAMSALMRPDIFTAVITMSHPFTGMPEFPFNTANNAPGPRTPKYDIQAELAKCNPPRKHYKWYNSTYPANGDWTNPAQGMHAFLRGYFHTKSADFTLNKPHPLEEWSASELAKMPHYYILPLDATMPEAIALDMRTEDADKTKRWLSDEELDVYVGEWSRTGFSGGLNWYRNGSQTGRVNDVALFSGKTIDVPAKFISGAQDWGNYQEPGAIENLSKTCTDFRGTVFVDGAGHWPQQEQPEKVGEEILKFLKSLESAPSKL